MLITILTLSNVSVSDKNESYDHSRSLFLRKFFYSGIITNMVTTKFSDRVTEKKSK